MLTLRQSQIALVPVVLTDAATGGPYKNVQYNNVQASVIKNDGTVVDLGTLVPADWTEITTGAYSQRGYYLLRLPVTSTDQEGMLHYGVAVTGADFYPGVGNVRANTEKEIFDRIGAPVLTDISHDIQVISASTGGTGGFQPTDRDMLIAVKGKTDLLTSDFATNTHVDASIAAAAFTSSDRANLGSIKAKTDQIGTATVASQSDVTSARDNINTNTNTRTTEIKGGTWNSTNDSLHGIRTQLDVVQAKTTNLPADPASQSAICGVGYDVATDSLHQLQLNLTGIVSGSGGFTATDRANLTSIFNVLPPSSGQIAGKPDLDAVQGTESTYGTNVKRTISETYVYARGIKAKTDYIQSTSVVATQADVNAARDYLAGTGFISGTDTLHQLSLGLGTNNFGTADRTLMNSIKTELDGVKSTGDSNRTDILGVRSKTDNLPTDPASNSHIDTVMGANANAFTVDDHNNLLSVLSNTNRIPANPATTTSGFQNADRDTITAINGKVQNLPADPASTTNITVLSNKVGTPRGATIAADIGEAQDLVILKD